MPTILIDFKNINIVIGNTYELYVSADIFNGAQLLGNRTVIVNVRGKTKAQVNTEARDLFAMVAKTLLEEVPEVLDYPTTVPNFNLSVTYEEP